MTRLVILAALTLAACACGRCHEGYHVVEYHPATTTTHWHKVGEVSVPYRVHHPEECSRVWVCQTRCGEIDEQRLEAHPEHATIKLPTINLSPERCQDNGRLR